MKTICLDPGHGMGNVKPGRYDPGASVPGAEEATIALTWANEIREYLRESGATVIRTRIDAKDPAHVGSRAGIAKNYKCEIMLSVHCNAADGKANGTETFYRGDENKALASKINETIRAALGTKDRGIKTEAQSQHKRLAVMAFQPCFLVELGFIDNPSDRAAMLDPDKRAKACAALAKVLLEV